MIYYSHVNEDNRIERSLMAEHAYPDLCCIAGSGERLMSLLDVPALQRVIAIDSNLEALHLLELKLAALKTLDVDRYLAFTGAHEWEPDARVGWYSETRAELSVPARTYWDARTDVVRDGVLYSGHFERFLDRMRPFVKLVLGAGFFGVFDDEPGLRPTFPARRWALTKRIFGRKWAYRCFGNSDEAFVGKGVYLGLIPDALQSRIDEDRVNRSFMFHLVFKGHLRDMPPDELPPSLRPDVLHEIREVLLHRRLEITLHHGDFLGYWVKTPPAHLQRCFLSLSDLPTFADFSYLLTFLHLLQSMPRLGHRAVLRTFTRNRLNPYQLVWLERLFSHVADVSEEELTGMYRVYVLDQ